MAIQVTLLTLLVAAQNAGSFPLPGVNSLNFPRWLEPHDSIMGAVMVFGGNSGDARGGTWWALAFCALLLIILTGFLAGLTLAVMSIDLLRLKVWTRAGSLKQRRYAIRILEVRNRPNWLLTSLVLASVMVAEGLPLILDHLFRPGSYVAFTLSTVAVALLGEIIPQSIMPLYILDIGGRCTWLVKTIMWLMAPIAGPLAYALRAFKKWRIRREPNKVDGILEMDGLVEFVRLHERSEENGGGLIEDTGFFVRTMMENQDGVVGQDVRPWSAVTLVNAASLVSPKIFERVRSCSDPYVLVVKGGTEIEEESPITIYDVHGILLVKEFLPSNDESGSAVIGGLPFRPIPIVLSTCSIHGLLALLTEERHSCALVVSAAHESLAHHIDDIMSILADLDPEIAGSLSPLGIIDYHDLVSRVLLGQTSHYRLQQATENQFGHGSLGRQQQRPSSSLCEQDTTGTVVRRRHPAPAIGLLPFEVDGVGSGTEAAPQQPRTVSLGAWAPKGRIFQRFSMSTSGQTFRPRRSLFAYFGRKED